jgi:lipopolysaccharide export system permease protein
MPFAESAPDRDKTGVVSGGSGAMGSIGRYIFRTTLAAFVMALVTLTGLIWVTYALRDFDLMTSQGQTIFVFISMTSLLIPMLMLVIAPVAFVIVVAYLLNKLTSDSEIIVMNAAGMSPWILFRAFFSAGLVVSVFVGFLSAYLAPQCMRTLREWSTNVRADVVANIVQPGKFLRIDHGLMVHIRERDANGNLLGIVVDDRRNPKETKAVLAERGQIIEAQQGSFLLLQNGSVQLRKSAKSSDPTIVNFETYGFDLSQFANTTRTVNFTVRERYLWDLIAPDPDDRLFLREPKQFQAELNDRLVTPLYPLAFVVIAYVFLGPPRTTRQGRAIAMVATIASVATLRFVGFASTVMGTYVPAALAIQYVALALVFTLGYVAISRGLVIEPPAWMTNAIAEITERLSRRFATA